MNSLLLSHHGLNQKSIEYLTVTVIPLEAHMSPYSLEVEVFSDQEKNLKQVFAHEKYWDGIFRNHSHIIPP